MFQTEAGTFNSCGENDVKYMKAVQYRNVFLIVLALSIVNVCDRLNISFSLDFGSAK